MLSRCCSPIHTSAHILTLIIMMIAPDPPLCKHNRKMPCRCNLLALVLTPEATTPLSVMNTRTAQNPTAACRLILSAPWSLYAAISSGLPACRSKDPAHTPACRLILSAPRSLHAAPPSPQQARTILHTYAHHQQAELVAAVQLYKFTCIRSGRSPAFTKRTKDHSSRQIYVRSLPLP